MRKFNNGEKLNKIDIPISILKNHFKKIFNEPETDLNDFQIKIVDEIKLYEESIILETELMTEFTDFDIDLAIKDSKNSKGVGTDGTCPFWLIKCNCPTVRQSLLKLFNLMQKNGNVPINFNLCIIRPIIKDFNKSNSDINNIRPISISNSIAQLFERLILNRNYKSFKTSDNQFGF